MTKTRRKKRIHIEQEKRRKKKKFLEKVVKIAWKLGFKTASEYLLWRALSQEGITAKHNETILGREVDIFLEPNLIVEVGYLIERWKYTFFEDHGYKVLYFANLEINNKTILKNTINTIKKALKRESIHNEITLKPFRLM